MCDRGAKSLLHLRCRLVVALLLVSSMSNAELPVVKPRRGAEPFISLGVQQYAGKATGSRGDALQATFGNDLQLSVGVRIPLGSRLAIEGGLGLLVGRAGLALRNACAFDDDSLCYTLGAAPSLSMVLYPWRTERRSLWIRNGIGARFVFAGSLLRNGIFAVAVESFRPAVGMDFAVGKGTAKLGAYAETNVGTMVSSLGMPEFRLGFSEVRDKALHVQLGVGIRFVP